MQKEGLLATWLQNAFLMTFKASLPICGHWDASYIIHIYFKSELQFLNNNKYELATGKPPFVSTSFSELMNQILHQDYPKLQGFWRFSFEMINN